MTMHPWLLLFVSAWQHWVDLQTILMDHIFEDDEQ